MSYTGNEFSVQSYSTETLKRQLRAESIDSIDNIKKWIPTLKNEEIEKIICLFDALLALDEDNRALILSQFCRHCGRNVPGCQCWNDD